VKLAQIAPIGIGVDLEHGPGARGALDDCLHIDLVRWPPLDLPSGWMSDRVDEGVLDGARDSLRHRLRAHAKR
jgi:hypothetical protein